MRSDRERVDEIVAAAIGKVGSIYTCGIPRQTRLGRAVLRSIPARRMVGAYWATLVGIFGITISPYLFFWQAAQEVEEERGQGALTVEARQGATAAELRKSPKRRTGARSSPG